LTGQFTGWPWLADSYPTQPARQIKIWSLGVLEYDFGAMAAVSGDVTCNVIVAFHSDSIAESESLSRKSMSTTQVQRRPEQAEGRVEGSEVQNVMQNARRL
jgi:hypothetical protein